MQIEALPEGDYQTEEELRQLRKIMARTKAKKAKTRAPAALTAQRLCDLSDLRIQAEETELQQMLAG